MSRPPDLAVVGNGRIAALVNNQGQLVWWCFPRFDSDPVFCRLIAGDEEKGFCDVVLDRKVEAVSTYERNTATVITLLTAEDGVARCASPISRRVCAITTACCARRS